MARVGRRTFLTTSAGAALGLAPPVAGMLGRRGAPSLLRSRLAMPSGVATGDVTAGSAVLWARASAGSRLHVRLSSNGRRLRSLRGPWVGPGSDHTAQLELTGLAPGRRYEATMWFAGADGERSEELTASFSTAPLHPAAQSFVWSGDTCGQSWGINDDVGGMTGYRAMREVRPDFFVHCGDHIYADEPVEETVVDRDGYLWRNRMDDVLDHPAQSLADFRGRHAYVLGDEHVRALHAEVPMVAQWDDHETTNNWYPGGVTELDGYTDERRMDVLARRGRQAFHEYMPIAPRTLRGRGGDGFASRRIYRKISRGAHLDVFVLDMRSYRGPNTPGHADEPTSGLLGAEQAAWLVREVAASTATWKVISADLPLSIQGPAVDTGTFDSYANLDSGAPHTRESELAGVLRGFAEHGVRNFFFITADVHYTAAHHYAPERSQVGGFDPFWEFVSGPIHASTFSVKPLDGTFGGRVVFSRGNDGTSQGPRHGNQFFGHVEISRDGIARVNLRNVGGEVLWSIDLEPQPGG